jgi:hypothetical protein
LKSNINVVILIQSLKLLYREKQILNNQIVELKSEVLNSTAAFDRYRERARLSLTKAADEQQAAEKKLVDAMKQIKV